MELSLLWFILIAVLFIGFFFLEGFDYGTMILMPFVAKNDTERRVVINSIGPVWDGNEVWLLTAGGAMFAAFPNWYATMFSGFYLALFLILVALIIRGVSFEFRSKMESKKWRNCFDTTLFIGSLLPAILFGVAFANLVQGVPIDAQMEYVGTFFDLLSPFTLVAGIAGLSFFVYHGAIYLSLKTTKDIEIRSNKIASQSGLAVIGLGALLFGISLFVFSKDINVIVLIIGILTLIAFVISYGFARLNHYGKAIFTNAIVIALGVITLFLGLFPNVMVSTIDSAYNLTIKNASSTPYTLTVMTIVALTLVPIVIAYQSYSYWVFRKRVTGDKLEY